MCKFFYLKRDTSGFGEEHAVSVFFLNFKTKSHYFVSHSTALYKSFFFKEIMLRILLKS